MFPKLLFAILAAIVVGAALLGLRHQRLQAMHEMAALHAEMDRSRREIWDLQVRIAEHLEPTRLRGALLRADGGFVPAAEPNVMEPDTTRSPQVAAGPETERPHRHE